MRLKVILGASVSAMVICWTAVYFKLQSEDPGVVIPPPVAENATAPAPAPVILRRAAVETQSQDSADPQDDPAAALKAAKTDEERKVELYKLGMSQDPAALPAIVAQLNSSDPEVRSTALAATMDIGSKDAIPALQNELSWTEDIHEKMRILKAIEFLQLPAYQTDGNGSFVQQQ